MHADPVDLDLHRYIESEHAADLDAQAQDEREAEEAAHAERVMQNPAVWGWHGSSLALETTGGVPYCVDEALLDGLEHSKAVEAAYMTLMASPAAAKLRAAVAAHWAGAMWETRSATEIAQAARQRAYIDFDGE